MKLTPQLFERFKRIDGAGFKAILTSATDGGSTVNSSFRILYVRKPNFVKVGDVVLSHGGENLILMEFPDDSKELTAFKVAYASKIVSWERQITLIDPVSGVPKGNGWADMGPLYLNFDMPDEAPVGTLNDTRYRFITGQEVKVGDRIEGKRIIKTIFEVLGVKLCFCE